MYSPAMPSRDFDPVQTTKLRQVLPPLVVTVAVTGHRALAPGSETALLQRIGALLDVVRDRIVAAQQVSALDRLRPLTLRFISALAPGADQIGARAACERTGGDPAWQLEAVLPFAAADYARTVSDDIFARGGSVGDAQHALAWIDWLSRRAERVLELADWQPGTASPLDRSWRGRRYATLGQLLTRQADLVIAVWDGQPAAGTGGTAELVQEARRSGVPVLWIEPGPGTADQVRSILSEPDSQHVAVVDLVARHGAPGDPVGAGLVDGAGPGIDQALRNVLLGQDEGRARAVTRYALDELTPEWRLPGSPMGDRSRSGDFAFWYNLLLYLMLLGQHFRDSVQPLRSWPFAWAFPADGWWRRMPFALVNTYRFDTGVQRDRGNASGAQLAAATANDAPIMAPAARADAIASRRSNHYRSAYVIIFGLAALAVALALAYVFHHPWKPGLVLAELLTVSTGFLVYGRTAAQPPGADPAARPFARDTHRRWLDARLIAESQRGNQVLAWLGFAGRRPIEDPPVEEDGAEGHRTVWAPWFANAIAALPGLPAPDPGEGPGQGRVARLTPHRLGLLAAAAGQVVAYQESYHRANHARLERLNHRLDRLGLGALGVAFVVSSFYLMVELLQLGHIAVPEAVLHFAENLAGFCGGVGPAVAAAAVGIRFQGDFERFAMRSQETAQRLRALGERARQLRAGLDACGAVPCADQGPQYEVLLSLMLDIQAALDEDLADWRFVYAARPLTAG